MNLTTVTYSSKKHYCKHANGWWKTVRIKVLFFTVSKTYFLCLDCEDLIPANEVENLTK